MILMGLCPPPSSPRTAPMKQVVQRPQRSRFHFQGHCRHVRHLEPSPEIPPHHLVDDVSHMKKTSLGPEAVAMLWRRDRLPGFTVDAVMLVPATASSGSGTRLDIPWVGPRREGAKTPEGGCCCWKKGHSVVVSVRSEAAGRPSGSDSEWTTNHDGSQMPLRRPRQIPVSALLVYSRDGP